MILVHLFPFFRIGTTLKAALTSTPRVVSSAWNGLKSGALLLPEDHTTIGLDEHTGIILDFETRTCRINGVSSIHLVRKCNPNVFPAGSDLPMIELGPLLVPEPIETGIPLDIWEHSHPRRPGGCA